MALVDGKLGNDGVFRASKLQAKCASKYEAKPVAPRDPQLVSSFGITIYGKFGRARDSSRVLFRGSMRWSDRWPESGRIGPSLL